MIPIDPPVFEVGTTDYVWGRFEERDKANVSAVGIQLQIVSPDGTASAWAAPALTDTAQAASGVLRAAALFTASTPGDYRLRAKLTDSPTVVVVTCGLFRVV